MSRLKAGAAIVAAWTAVFASASVALSQTPASQAGGTGQVVGLFTAACIRNSGDPSAVRDFLRARHVPELKPEARPIFLQGYSGVGFDASNQLTRLALVSEDNGVCSAFGGQADPEQLWTLIESAMKNQGVQISQTGQTDQGQAIIRSYVMSIKGRPFKLVASMNTRPGAPIQAILTLSP